MKAQGNARSFAHKSTPAKAGGSLREQEKAASRPPHSKASAAQAAGRRKSA
jgi:hypothetical protein